MRRVLTVCAATTAALVLAAVPAAAHGSKDPRPPSSETITSGLITPLSLAVGPKGTTFVSQNFAGLLTAVDRDGDQSVIHSSGGAEVGAVSYDDGVVTFAESGENFTLHELTVNKRGEPRGEARQVADLGAYEAAKNPDAKNRYGLLKTPQSCLDQFPEEFPFTKYTGIVESHPYATTTHRGTTYVADAAGNSVLAVDHRGKVRTVAVLPPQPAVITAEAAAVSQFPECSVGETYWFEPVPTDVEVGPLGILYVSLLPGGPEDPSMGPRGSVVAISPWSGRSHTVAKNLFAPTGIAVDKWGTLYVAELFGGQITKPGWRGNSTVVSVPMPGDIELDGSSLLATTGVLSEDPEMPSSLVRYSLGSRWGR